MKAIQVIRIVWKNESEEERDNERVAVLELIKVERGDKSVVGVGQIKYRREMSLLSEVLIKEVRKRRK